MPGIDHAVIQRQNSGGCLPVILEITGNARARGKTMLKMNMAFAAFPYTIKKGFLC